MIKEACVENLKEALLAEQHGANRVEICENLAVGGTTPSYGMIKICKQHLSIPFMIMIRPRGGDFTYSEPEYETMKEDIRICNALGADGVVFGILTPENAVDIKRTRELVELAHPMQVTFHKAFDNVNDPFSEMEKLIEAGVHRILTSGLHVTAMKGTHVLKKLIQKANGHIKIIVAGKVTKENLAELSHKIPANEFHGRRIVFNPEKY